MIHYIIALDLHEYRQNRFRIQLVFLYLLFSATRERLRAVVRSEAYRHTNNVLCYKVKLFDSHRFPETNLLQDVELFMKPLSNSDFAPIFVMYITFNYKKGEQLDNED